MNRISGQYNVRCVFEKVENQLTFSDSILGELINQTYLGKVYINDKSDIRLLSPNSGLSEHKIDFSLQGEFNIGVKIFKDKPVHTLPAIDVLPIPVEIITIYFYISEMKQEVYGKISIRDTGRGIPAEHQAQIFQRFYREPEVHDEDGIGIGLYLARKIVTMQDGYMEVHSESGKGAQFCIYLPMK